MTEKPDLSTMAKRLKYARGLVPTMSAAELGRLAGISVSIPAAIERGDSRDPSVSTVLALADALGVTSSWLAGGQGRLPFATRVRARVSELRAKQPPPGRSGPKPRAVTS